MHVQNCKTNHGDTVTYWNAVNGGSRSKRALNNMLVASAKIAGTVIGTVSGLFSGFAIYESTQCGKSGCYKGYCYSYCGLSNESGDWCYTTKTYSQSFDYVKCSIDSDCNGCWKCAGSCTVG